MAALTVAAVHPDVALVPVQGEDSFGQALAGGGQLRPLVTT